MVDSVFNSRQIGYHQYDLRVAYGINSDAHCVRNPKNHRGHFLSQTQLPNWLNNCTTSAGEGERGGQVEFAT